VVNEGFLLLVQLESGSQGHVEDEYLPKMDTPYTSRESCWKRPSSFALAFLAMVEVKSALDKERWVRMGEYEVRLGWAKRRGGRSRVLRRGELAEITFCDIFQIITSFCVC